MAENALMESIKKSLFDIGVSKLKESGRGFYAVDFLFVDDRFHIQAEAGFQMAEVLQISSSLRYDPLSGKITAGLRFGGEVRL